MSWLSNLFKAGYVSFDSTEPKIIDNNELANKKIEAFQEQELKRQRAQMAQEDYYGEGSEDGDFVPGIDMEQLSQLTEDQSMLESVPVPGPIPDPQFDMEAMQAEIDFKLQQAQEQADMIIQDAQSQAESIRQNAIEQGRQEGYNDGYQEGAAAAAALQEDVELKKEELEKQYQQIVDELEPEMVDVLTQIYEHVFNIELREDKGIILHLLKTTLSRIEPGNDLIVHVSSDDYDDIMEQNECMIESDSGVFDCSLGVELSEITRKLKLLSFDRKRR